MAETEVHLMAMIYLIGALRFFFRKHTDVYVIGNMFLYYREGNPRARKAPDVMVVKGVDKHERRSFKVWEEAQAVPSVIFEVTSRETKREDTINKASLYASLGIKEYILFDPLHEYLDNQLEGYRLVDGEYEPIPANEDGELFSSELQLILRPEEAMLRLVDPQTHQPLPTLDEAAESAQDEAQRAQDEARRAAAAEAEVARLRALLAELKRPPA
jgi:Uma2 family endonuclease